MRIRRTTSAASVLVLALALAGCGGGEDEAKPLTQEQITSALISTDDIGDEFQVMEEDEDDDTDLGCLGAVDDIDDGFPGAEHSAEVSIEASTDGNVPEVGNQINTFTDEAAATKALDDFAASLDGCDSVQETSDDVTFDLEIETDDSPLSGDVDQQLDIDVEGTVASGEVEFPLSQRVRFMRIGSVITATYFSSLQTSTRSEANDLAELAVAKILPLIEGGEVGTPEPLDLEPYTG